MRQLIISGNLARDPETKATQNGRNFVQFLLLNNKKTGNGHEDKMAVNVKVFGAMGETCCQFLHKGSWAMVAGELSVSIGQDGKTYYDVLANTVDFGPKQGGNNGYQQQQYGNGQQQYNGGYQQQPQQQYAQQPYNPPAPQGNPPPPIDDQGDSPF